MLGAMIVSVILHIALQPTGLHLAFNLPLSKLYTNSLMSSLNSRSGWKYGTGTGDSVSDDLNRAERARHLGIRGESGRRVSQMVRMVSPCPVDSR